MSYALNFQLPSSITTRKRDVITSDIQFQQQTETVYFGEHPVTITCPKCGKEMTTKTTFVIGSMTWVFVMAVFCTFWCLL